MSTTFEQRMERRMLEVESGGAAAEAVGGLAVIVISILGLVGLAPEPLAAIAGIIFGVAILAQGSTIAAEYYSLYSRLSGGALGTVELGGGMTVEVMAGGAAIVLGILALLGMAPEILLPALVITAGGSLILAAGAVQRLNNLKLTAAEPQGTAQRVMHVATSGAAAGQLLAGIAAIVLGIIALASMPTMGTAVAASATATWLTLTLVGLLVLGTSVAMSGGSLAGRLFEMFNREENGSHKHTTA